MGVCQMKQRHVTFGRILIFCLRVESPTIYTRFNEGVNRDQFGREILKGPRTEELSVL